jgi:hypothetical protein
VTVQTSTTGPTLVIVAYKPSPAERLTFSNSSASTFRCFAPKVATDHPVTACQAKDGTIVEVFEWVPGGVERAHTNPVIHALWARYAAACDFVPLATLPEASTMFASFTPIAL